jgi:hypothetical protein
MASRPSRSPERKVTHRAARFFRILPGLRPLAGGNCYEAVREGSAPLLEVVLLCATEASAYCYFLQMHDGNPLETVLSIFGLIDR